MLRDFATPCRGGGFTRGADVQALLGWLQLLTSCGGSRFLRRTRAVGAMRLLVGWQLWRGNSSSEVPQYILENKPHMFELKL